MKLIWTPRSRADLDRIWLFLADREVDLAERIDGTIRDRAKRLLDHPRLGHPIAQHLYQWTIVEIQYVVTYAIEDGRVRIVRVHHTRENREQP